MLSAQDKSKRATKWQELLQWIGCEGFKLRSFKFQIHSMQLSHLLRKSTQLTIGRYIGQLLVGNQLTIGRQLTDSRPTVNQ